MKTILTITTLFILATTPQLTWSQLVQWPSVEGGNNHYYEVVPALGGIAWNDASLNATNRGGHLATITSGEENTFVFSLASQNTNIWYGGYGPWLGGIQPIGSPEPSGGWAWITGEPFTYQNWASAQPNNNAGEDRIHFGGLASISSAWNDLGQNNTNYSRGFVVEYPHHPNSVTMQVSTFASEEVQLRWASRSNVQYAIEWTEELPTELWNPLTTVTGNGTTNTVETATTEPQRFYRITVPE